MSTDLTFTDDGVDVVYEGTEFELEKDLIEEATGKGTATSPTTKCYRSWPKSPPSTASRCGSATCCRSPCPSRGICDGSEGGVRPTRCRYGTILRVRRVEQV